MTNKLNVYECRRWTDEGQIHCDSWAGAVIVAAQDVQEAQRIAEDHERDCNILQVVQINGVYADSPSRVLYDDSMR